MAYRYDDFAPGEVYHLCTRGIDHKTILRDKADHERFLALLLHCLPQGTIRSYSIAKRRKDDIRLTLAGEGLIDLLGYCLMSNHVHLLIKENTEGGTSLYMQRLLNSYAKYFNIRYTRSGPLFTGRFKAVLVDDDDQLLHVSRYIHLNPYVAHMVEDIFSYCWSSLEDYVSKSKKNEFSCHTDLISKMMNQEDYRLFVSDEADYARTVEDSKHLLLDYED